jgi:pimeloyl-ACP methyl ester carboxylesterase
MSRSVGSVRARPGPRHRGRPRRFGGERLGPVRWEGRIALATFALIHGAGDSGWYWHLVAAELRARAHDVVAPDLPTDDRAGLWTYADTVVQAIDGGSDLAVVGQSFGAFTAPLVCHRVPADLLVFVAGMIPAPGEPPDDWWSETGYLNEPSEWRGDDLATYYHDVPPELAAEALRRARDHPSPTAEREPWPLSAIPDVPTRALLCRDDRLFPAPFMRRLARVRLDIEADEIEGGHCVALSRPIELADRLEAFLEDRS